MRSLQSGRGLTYNEEEHMSEKDELRLSKTQKAICSSFAELLAEKELHRISVQEVSDKARISRTTFYRYYTDVYELYDSLSKNILTELGRVLRDSRECSEEELYTKLIRYVSENSMTFKMIFSPNTTAKLKERVIKMFESIFRHKYSEVYNVPINSPELIYFVGYRANGLISVIRKWVLTDFKESCGYMVRLISDIDGNMAATFQTGVGAAYDRKAEMLKKAASKL